VPLIAETTFWGVIGWIFWVFLLAIWFYLLIVVFMDLFSRHDLSGWAKAAWTIGIIIFPLIGILIYLITRPKPTPEEVAEAQAAEARAAGITAADQLTQLSALHDQGKLTDEEFAAEKKKLIGS
jgi:hypothetical protein